MPTICLLIDDHGSQIEKPIPVDATVSWRQADGVAQAFDPAGKLIFELHHARPEWIEKGGIRFVGVERKGKDGRTLRAQEWQFNPA